MLPPTTREALEDAMTQFDQNLRADTDWRDWEHDANYKFAIVWNGRQYPVKQIVSMATGTPRQAFSGGDEANGYVHRYGLETVPLPQVTGLDAPAVVSSVWWVNQGSTYQHERRGGFLWAPLKDQRGAALAHWESLAKVRRGDVVVHYLDGEVRALSLATSEAELMPRPAEFGTTAWSEEGRRLLVTYYELGTPIPRSAVADQIKSLQISYGPIAENGGVKQGYLWHFSLDGLRLLRATSREVWLDWATAMLEGATPTQGPSVLPVAGAPLVFVSHSHKDDAFTSRLVTDLRAAGADVWVDVTDLTHDDFVTRINAGLKGRQWLILVMSPDALRSDWVQLEVNAAIGLVMQRKMRSIIPIVALPCDPDDIPPLWAAYHRYDATANYSAALALLLQVLGHHPSKG